MSFQSVYNSYKKPRFAPPAWLFGPVWAFLYVLILVSAGSVVYAIYKDILPLTAALPFVLNLIANGLYTPLQFRLGSFWLALVDILIVDCTLVWTLFVLFPILPFAAYILLPYLAWVLFATVLQIAITYKNA